MPAITAILSIDEGIDDIAESEEGRVDTGRLLEPIASCIGRTLTLRSYVYRFSWYKRIFDGGLRDNTIGR